MATHSKRVLEEKITREEWYLPLPSNWTELDKLLRAVQARSIALGDHHDDSFSVEADDEEIRIVRETREDA